MRKLELLVVGKVKEKYFLDGIAEYAKRISRYADLTITELADSPHEERAVADESRLILSKMSGYTILADLEGSELDSPSFASVIEKAYITNSKVQFIIGGSYGVSGEVKRRANMRVRFGKMTFPHKLMRLIATEQLYRAFTITDGTSYHK